MPSGAPGTEGAPKKRRKKGEAGPDAALSVKTEGNLANGTPDNPDSGVATPTALAKPGAEADAPEKVRVKITEETPLHDSLLPAMQHLRDLASLGGAFQFLVWSVQSPRRLAHFFIPSRNLGEQAEVPSPLETHPIGRSSDSTRFVTR